MILHYWWEDDDVEPGTRVSPADRNDAVLIIGWANWLSGKSKNKWVLIDPRDGMVYYKPSSKTKLCAHLTEMNYRPRPELRNVTIE